MTDTTNLIMIIVILSIFEIIVFYSLKKYADTKKKYFFLLAILSYVIIAYMLSYSFTNNKMAIVNSLWNGISMFLIILLGYVIFKQSLKANEIVAIIFIMIAIMLIAKK